MSDVFPTLADLVKINDRNNCERNISDLLDQARLIRLLAADYSSNGEFHKYTKQTGAPVVGYRAANAGRAFTASTDTQVTIQLGILDGSCAVDKAVASTYIKGASAYVAREAGRHLRQAFFWWESQVLYGTGNDAAGPLGLAQDSRLVFKNSAMVVDAAGTTGSTGSDVWLIRTGLDDMMAIVGNEGVIQMGQTVEQDMLTTDTPPKHYTGLYTSVLGWTGVQVGSAYSVARICNLTADSGKGLTDALISTALSLFKAGQPPSYLAMGRRSLMQLQKSRTATNPTGAPAPFPSESFGVPIVVCDTINATGTLLGAST